MASFVLSVDSVGPVLNKLLMLFFSILSYFVLRLLFCKIPVLIYHVWHSFCAKVFMWICNGCQLANVFVFSVLFCLLFFFFFIFSCFDIFFVEKVKTLHEKVVCKTRPFWKFKVFSSSLSILGVDFLPFFPLFRS